MATPLAPGMLYVSQGQECSQLLSLGAAGAALQGNMIHDALCPCLIAPSDEIHGIAITFQALDEASSLFQGLALDFKEPFNNSSLLFTDNSEKLHCILVSRELALALALYFNRVQRL